VILVLKDRIAIKSNRLICNATGPKEVADGFCYQYDNLERIGIKDLNFEGRTFLIAIRLTIVGKIYVNAPVSSNMITTTVTVILITPLRAAAAPRKA
jgi:hypothetical protein